MKKKPFWKYFLVFLVLFGIFLGALFALGFVKFNQIQGFLQLSKSGAFAPPPTAVTTAIASKTDWQSTMESVGSLAAVNGVTVSTDLAGIVTDIAFESGSKVHAGDLLVHMDTKQEEAQLHQAQAQRDWASVSLKRASRLRQR
jgi:membrane fusion protein, multidrug efflux system